jgi:hypothetical protein
VSENMSPFIAANGVADVAAPADDFLEVRA